MLFCQVRLIEQCCGSYPARITDLLSYPVVCDTFIPRCVYVCVYVCGCVGVWVGGCGWVCVYALYRAKRKTFITMKEALFFVWVTLELLALGHSGS